MDKFFIRFRLQRSKCTFNDEQLDCLDMIGGSREEIAEFLSECEVHRNKCAEKLRKKFRGKLNPLHGKRVLFCGDSITSDRLGYREAVTEAAKLNACNVSFSGAVSSDLLLGIKGDIEKSAPELISIMIGANDSLCINREEKINICSPDEYRRNLRSILNFAAESGAAIAVMQISMLDERVFNNSAMAKYRTNTHENISIYNQIIDEEAARIGAALVRTPDIIFAHKDINLYESDGIHLSPEAHVPIAESLLKTVINLLGVIKNENN